MLTYAYYAYCLKGGDIFDVAMGAYDGAEVCELVGTFLLEKISEICNKSTVHTYGIQPPPKYY